MGFTGVVIDALVLTSTFLLAYFLGTKWLKLNARTAILIGAGSSICGVAAVMVTEPVVRARSDESAVAVSTVVIFGTISMFHYPVLFALNQRWQLFDFSPSTFGVYIGSAVHEVAQVLVAGKAISDSVVATAVISKMIGVMMLAPFLILLSVWLSRKERHG